MQNIDPVYILIPVVVVGFSFGSVLYWHFRRSFSKWVLLYSLAAYAGAIALKYIVQIPTIGAVESASGGDPAVLGLYYGVQTAVFEVGGAFLVARIAFSKGRFGAKDAEGYGLGLAFWENGVLIGLPLLINYTTYYALLSFPNLSVAQTVYNLLVQDAPALFYGPGAALPQVGLSILERVSSLLAHFSWGYLAVLSVVFRKRIYLALAFPMGFIDFTVPYAQYVGGATYEFLLFIMCLGCLATALLATGGDRRAMKEGEKQVSTAPVSAPGADPPPPLAGGQAAGSTSS